MSMSTASPSLCQRCGASLDYASVDGLCARCLGALNFTTDTALPGENATQVPPLTPEELAPQFPQLEILECLGRGGMGVVYKARQKSLNRLVALKLLAPERADDPQFAARFEKEAQALAALNHPHIVGVYDFGQAGGFYFLLMEYVDGVNLRQAMKAGRFTPEQALAIVPPVCEALQYAHEHGIVHRDIKPENLLLDKEGRVKIADFGIAKMLGESGTGVSPVIPDPTAGTAVPQSIAAGTPQYMAPEQKAHRATDHRADIYSLGVVLYEMLTGELPADNLQPPSRKVQIDVRLDEIVLRALEQTPELRYQTAGEFRMQVDTIANGSAAIPNAANSEYVTSWGFRLTTGPAIKTGYVRFWEKLFGSVTSSGAINALNLSRLGLIGCLAVLAIVPGWRWFWPAFAFLGMFGLIGAAYLSEAAARRGVDLSETRGSPEAKAQRALWRRRVVWLIVAGGILPMAFFAVSLIASLGRGGEKAVESATTGQMLIVFAKVFGIGSGPALLIWAVLRAFRREAANETDSWPRHPEALFALGMLWPLLLVAAPVVILQFVSATRPQSTRLNAAEWITLGLVLFVVLQGAIWITQNVRRTLREANDPPDRPKPELQTQPRWQGWDVWVLGLCLAIFGALWLLRLSEGPLLNRSLFAGAGVGSNVVLPVALATTILLAGAAFLYMLARNIKTASSTRTESWKRTVGRSVVPAIAVILLLRTFVIHPFVVPNNSMSPEITKGSRILVWKLTSTYAPGDIVAYRHEDKIWVARVTQVGPTMLTLQKNSKPDSEVQREAVVGKVISVFWRPSPGVNSGVMQPPPQRAENARPAAATESWSPSPAPISTEDVRKISTDAKTLQELVRYEEALERHLWLHHHASKVAPGSFGVRLSFWLSDWAELALRFPKAKQALVETRDQKSRELAAGRGDFGLFADVDSINAYLHDDAATLALFKQIEQANPEVAMLCAPLVEEAARRMSEQGERVITPSQWPLEKALADLQVAKTERDLMPSKSFPSEGHKENEALKLARKVELFEENAARRRAQLEQSLGEWADVPARNTPKVP